MHTWFSVSRAEVFCRQNGSSTADCRQKKKNKKVFLFHIFLREIQHIMQKEKEREKKLQKKFLQKALHFLNYLAY